VTIAEARGYRRRAACIRWPPWPPRCPVDRVQLDGIQRATRQQPEVKARHGMAGIRRGCSGLTVPNVPNKTEQLPGTLSSSRLGPRRRTHHGG
jgi:hypothetical protein